MSGEHISINELKHINFHFTEVPNSNYITGVSAPNELDDFLYVVYDKNTSNIVSIQYMGNFLDINPRNIELLKLLYNNIHAQNAVSEKHTIDELSNIDLYSKEKDDKIICQKMPLSLYIICDKNTGIIESIKIVDKNIKITSENIHFLEKMYPGNIINIDEVIRKLK